MGLVIFYQPSGLCAKFNFCTNVFAVKWCGFPPREIDEAAFIDLVQSNILGYDIGVRAGNRLQYACEGGQGIDSSRNPLRCGAAQGEWIAPYPDCVGKYGFPFTHLRYKHSRFVQAVRL